MDVHPAWIEWERITAMLFMPALVVLILGECCLGIELAGRVLGTYIHTWGRIVRRVLFVLLACVALAVPMLLALLRPGGMESSWVVLSTVLSLAIIVHFLFPYHFGIRRIDPGAGVTGEQPLAQGIILRRVAVEMRLPPGGPGSVRCLVLSDLHCTRGSILGKFQAALTAMPQVCHDLVLVLGDLGERVSLLPEVMRTVASLRPTYGVFCVYGNHEHESGRDRLIADLARENSIILLCNASYVVPGLGIEIVGLDTFQRHGALPVLSEGDFAIGLTHTPDNIMAFSRLKVPLAFAGHTHGGKIRLPWIGSFPVPSKYGRFLDEGWFERCGTRLYITPGLGHLRRLAAKRGVILDLTIIDPMRHTD